MTPKQILDSFSETLMQDERILSAQERALLATLLQHAKLATGETPETQQAVRAVIASAVGETVAQRAFAVLGGSIVERILESSPLAPGDAGSLRDTDIYAKKDPQSPGVKAPQKPHRRSPIGPESPGQPMRPHPPEPAPEPQAPNVRPPSKPSHQPLRGPAPPSPSLPDPQSPGHGLDTKVVAETGATVAERPAVLPAHCVVLDEFLMPPELEELMRFTLGHEAHFSASEVVSPTEVGGIINYEHRRSRVLMDLEHYQDVMLDRIKAVLPQVLHTLGMEEFAITGVEAQITASNDGDFFHFHSDNASDRVASRHLTFVYFFHREPRQFEGGELQIHDALLENGVYVSQGSHQTIVPQQNQIVFFPCELLHEITPVKCASQLFADSRFTLNGWLRH
jgi:hypothetical protein